MVKTNIKLYEIYFS
jgi:hypothetical protein